MSIGFDDIGGGLETSTLPDELLPPSSVIHPLLIAVDGPDASGKSTLGAQLQTSILNTTGIETVFMSGVNLPRDDSTIYQKNWDVYELLREELEEAENKGDRIHIQRVYASITKLGNIATMEYLNSGIPVILDSSNLRIVAFNYYDQQLGRIAVNQLKSGDLGVCFPMFHIRLDGDEVTLMERQVDRGVRSRYDPRNFSEISQRRNAYKEVYNRLEQDELWRRNVRRLTLFDTGVSSIETLLKFLKRNGYGPLQGI